MKNESNIKKMEADKELINLNEIDSFDAFEIIDVEEKLDFTLPPNGACIQINVWCS